MRKHFALLTTAGILAAAAVPAYASTQAKPKPVSAKTTSSVTKPAPTPKHYAVASGDNLSSIAQAQGLDSWRPLWNANINISNPDLVYPGQDLVVPNGTTTDRPLPDSASAAQLDASYDSAAATNPRSVAHYGTRAATAPVYASGNVPDILNRVKQRESGGNYATNTGNGYYGAYQYDLGTWGNYDGYARPDLAPPSVQDAKAVETYNRRGCSPWPNTCY